MVMAELAVNPSQVRERVAAKMREREANSQLAKTPTSAEPSPSESNATVGRAFGHIAAVEARRATRGGETDAIWRRLMQHRRLGWNYRRTP